MRSRSPTKMADVLSELLARSGCLRVRASQVIEEAWRTVVGEPLGEHTRLGHLRRGGLEVFVTHSTLVQELSFRKQELLAALASRLPGEGIKELRFRLAALT